MLTAFVAGATGYTGREVVRLLCEQGHTTVAHIRPDSSRLDDWRERFEAMGARVDVTPWEADAMRETLVALSPDLVFSALGTSSGRRSRARKRGEDASYEAVDVRLTAMVVDAAAACEPAPRVTLVTSAGVSEKARGAYMRTRWRMESHLRASGAPWTIARPAFITGDDRDDGRAMERYGAAITDSALGVLGALGARGLRDRYRSTTNTTLARALVRLAQDPAYVDTIVESESLRD